MRPLPGWALIPLIFPIVISPSLLAQVKPAAASDSRQIHRETGIEVPAGTRVVLQLTSPVWARSARAGLRVYARTVFPVALNNVMVIPAGTYVEGMIDAVNKPTVWSNRAQFQMRFTKWIFANGYTVELAGGPSGGASANGAASGENAAGATANVLVEVSYANDVLLDNGTEMEMTVNRPVWLERTSIAKAVQVSRPLGIGSVKSATRCKPTPGTPGTPDTVIPGTPGTPDIVIPGGPGMPDTVIPGTPATPGTPDTVIPGTPGTAGVACPGPPIVLSSSTASWNHTQNFQVTTPFEIGGAKLPAGKYAAAWAGERGQAQVDIVQDRRTMASAPARISALRELARRNEVTTRRNPDGTIALVQLTFARENVALSFGGETATNDAIGKTKAPR